MTTTISTTVDRLNEIFNSVSPDSELYLAGLHWYQNAHMLCVEMANKYDLELETVAAVVAALSPRNNWGRNLRDAENVISHLRCNTPLMPCCTFNSNRDKAILIARGNLKALSGRKVLSFASNIMSPEYSTCVTVDTWMIIAGFGQRLAVTNKRYDDIEKAIQTIARLHRIAPCQVQAIIWCVVRGSAI